MGAYTRKVFCPSRTYLISLTQTKLLPTGRTCGHIRAAAWWAHACTQSWPTIDSETQSWVQGLVTKNRVFQRWSASISQFHGWHGAALSSQALPELSWGQILCGDMPLSQWVFLVPLSVQSGVMVLVDQYLIRWIKLSAVKNACCLLSLWMSLQSNLMRNSPERLPLYSRIWAWCKQPPTPTRRASCPGGGGVCRELQ